MRLFKRSSSKKNRSASQNIEAEKKLISGNADETKEEVKRLFGNSSDLDMTPIYNSEHIRLTAIYIDVLADKRSLDSLSIEISQLACNIENNSSSTKDKESDQSFQVLKSIIPSFRKFTSGNDFNCLCNEIVSGNTVLLMDGCDKFISVSTLKPQGRSVQEPTSQSTVRGPKNAFIEESNVNIALIRQRIRTNLLRCEQMTIGAVAHTKISLMYIEGIAKPEIINEIRRRLSTIRIDGILDSGYIVELIKDDRYSIFPTILNSEKPDSVCSDLLNGKVAILVDGSAYVLTAPALFFDFLHASDDYYHNFIFASFVRLLRLISLCLTLFVPATYVALLTFHHEMIPTKLLINIASQREGVPFPALVEVIIMESVFEILREASIRIPRVIGPAISIAGALVLGQAVVEASIVSAAVVIVVSVTAIASFTIPNYSLSNSIRVLRFVFILVAAPFGLYGIFMGVIVLILHLCKLKSIGVPYMTPIAPLTKYVPNNTIVRYPLWWIKYRQTGVSKDDSEKTSVPPVDPIQKRKQEFK